MINIVTKFMAKKKRIWAFFLVGVMTAGCLSGCGSKQASSTAGSSVGTETEDAQESSAEKAGDTQVINLRTTSFGNNYDVQDMGWRWMMAACYDGIYRNVGDESGDQLVLAGAEDIDVSKVIQLHAGCTIPWRRR